MGFLASGSTISVEAKLTKAGKEKIFNSIENNQSGFITKFAIGDSDANYTAINAGTPTLASGHVPEVGDYKPSIRSFALYKGTYRPGVPVVLVDGEYSTDNGLIKDVSIGSNQLVKLFFDIGTEWPKNSDFTETYIIKGQNPGNMTESTFSRLFTIGRYSTGEYTFQFNGGATNQELETLLGVSKEGSTTIRIRIQGTQTNAVSFYNIRLVQ